MERKSFIVRKPSRWFPSRRNSIIIFAILPLLFSLITLAGWATGVDVITRWHPHYIPMAPSTAISFLLLVTAVFLSFFRPLPNYFRLAKIPVLITGIISLLVLIHIISGGHFNIETIIVSHPPHFHGLETARMSPATALFFLFISLSLYFYFSHARRFRQAASLMLTLCLGIIALFDLGYLLDNPLLYGEKIIPPAINTVGSFTFLLVAILLRFGFHIFPVKLFTGDSLHARLLRAFLPPGIIILLLTGILESRMFSLSGTQVFFSSLIIIVAIFVLGFVIMRISGLIGKEIDQSFRYRAKAEAELRESEERFRKSISEAPFPAIIHADDGRILSLNKTFTDLTGYTLDDLPTMEDWISHSDARLQSEIRAHVANLYRLKERIDEGEFPVLTKDQKVLTWDFSTAPLGKQPNGTNLLISMAKDTTERKEADRLLKEKDKWLKESQRIGRIGSYNINLKEWTWTSSEIFDEILGINGDFEKNMDNWLKLIHPDHLEEMGAYFNEVVIGNREAFNREYKIKRHNTGEERWIWSHGEINYSDSGEPENMIGTVQDITERKFSEYQFEKSLSLVKATLESTADGILVVNSDGKIVEYNQRFAEMWNIPEHILVSHSDEKAINYILKQLEDPQQFIDKVTELYAETEATSFDTLSFKDGRIFERYSQPLRMNQKSVGRVWSFRDITERKRIEQNLKETQLLLKSTIESATDIIILAIDKSYCYLNFNHTHWLTMKLVYDVEIAVGMNLWDCIRSEEDIQKIKPNYERALQGESHSQTEHFGDGEGGFYETFYNPIINDKNEIIGATAFSINITERKKAEAELIQAKELAEENDRLKTAFLHNISHEIRTPMNSILGFSELLCEEAISTEERRKYTSLITQSGEHLLSIITDIINIATIESGQVKINQREVNLKRITDNLISQFQREAEQKKLELRQSIPSELQELSLLTDEVKLIQILTNLVGNALKFTQHGYIEFGYRLAGMFIEFHIKDTGAGIPEELQEKIFERFQQADSNISKEHGGAGLGLAISKAYIELLGGQIWLQSEPKKGSVFRFTIPYIHPEIVAENEAGNTVSDTPTDVSTILVVEDEEYSFLLLKSMLPEFRLVHTTQLTDALHIIQANPNINIVFTDIKLVEDGIDLIKKIKAFRPQMPVIAMTTYGQKKRWNKIQSIGFDEYIKRPFRKDDIKNCVAKFIQ